MTHSRDIVGESATNWRTHLGSDRRENKAADAHQDGACISAQLWDDMRALRCQSSKTSNDNQQDARQDGRQDIRQAPPPLKDGDYKLVPKVHVVKAGEVLNRIARAHLGDGTSENAVQKHIANIVRVNGLPSADRIKEGQTLKLPGETKDGGFAVKDAAGNVRIDWKDGSSRQQNVNGTGFSKQMQDGKLVTTHWGPRPGDHYQIEKSGTNKVLIDIAEEDRVVPSNDATIQKTRAALLEHSRVKIKDEHQRSKFEFDMNRFEQRAKATGMPMDEVKKTYEQIDRLFSENLPKAPLSTEWRVKIAQQVMSQSARPSSIDQGMHNTCSVSSIEVRTYSLYPASAARLVADTATTGSFTSDDGTTVKTNPRPRTESLQNPPKDGERSHASQIFQVAAVNLHYAKENKSTEPPKHLRYEQFDKATHGSSTGEGVFDYSDVVAGKSTVPKLLHSQPELWDDELVGVSNAITGRNEVGFVIAHTGEGKDRKGVVGRFDSPEAFKKTVADLHAKKMLPASIRLHSANDPFYTDSENGAAGGSGGWHQATILKYDPADPNFIEVDNSWGSKNDHRKTEKMSFDEMYAATRAAGSAVTVAFLEQAAQKRQADNRPNLIADLELSRQRKMNSMLTPDAYVRQLESDLKAHRDRNNGAAPTDDRTKRKVSQVTLPTFTGDQSGELLVRVLHVREQVGVLTKQVYEDELYKVAMGLSKQKEEALKKGEALAGADAANFESTLNAIIDVVDDLDETRRTKFIQRLQKDAKSLQLVRPQPIAQPDNKDAAVQVPPQPQIKLDGGVFDAPK